LSKPANSTTTADPQPGRIGRRPGNPDTRRQILESAREIFASSGFAKASIRKIAARAGVDSALVHHYFGSKDELFLASVHVEINPKTVLEALITGDPRELGTRVITAFLQVWESPAGASLVAAVRTAIGDPDSARAFGQFITDEVISTLLRSLHYPPAEAELRGALVTSQLLGVVIGRYVLGMGHLPALEPAFLIATVGPTLQRYLTGELPKAFS